MKAALLALLLSSCGSPLLPSGTPVTHAVPNPNAYKLPTAPDLRTCPGVDDTCWKYTGPKRRML